MYRYFIKNKNDFSTNGLEKGTLIIKNEESPSVQYYIFDEKNMIDSFQLGLANIDQKYPVNDNTTYNFFSVTKTFTALAIMQLVEQNQIDLDQRVSQYLLDFPYHSEITVRQLLNHTSGIPNPIPLSWIHLNSEQDTFDRNIFFEEIFNKNKRLKSKPGKVFAYSNLGYLFLGLLIEKVSGNTYEEYITENIIKRLPIDPNDLTFTITDGNRHAVGYHDRKSFSNLILGFLMNKRKFMYHLKGKWNAFNYFYVNGAPYGGLVGKPSALVKFVQELLKDDSTLISPPYKQMLFKENEDTGMCLAWFSGQLESERYLSHSGGGGGYYCEIRIYPRKKVGSTIFFNRTGMSDERYLDNLDIFYSKFLK